MLLLVVFMLLVFVSFVLCTSIDLNAYIVLSFVLVLSYKYCTSIDTSLELPARSAFSTIEILKEMH